MEQFNNTIQPLIRYPIRNYIQESGSCGNSSSASNNNQQQQQQQHRLLVIQYVNNASRRDVQYLVDFLQGDDDAHEVTELELHVFSLVEPSDGGLNVLCDFFTNQTTLTKVELAHCNFGIVEEEAAAARLISAIRTNASVTDLTIRHIRNLEQGSALGNCISGLLQNMPHLQRLALGDDVDVEVIRAFQPGLRTNRHLKILDLSYCKIRDEGLHHIVDALVGNTTMEVLDISNNDITSNGGLDDITRLLESTQVRNVNITNNDGVFDDNTATENFAHALSRNQFLKILGMNMYLWVTPSHVAAMIFRALESNSVLEQVEFAQFRDNTQALIHLMDSLPRIKSLRRLHLCRSTRTEFAKIPTFWNCFVPALHENTSLEELLGLDLIRFPQPEHKATIMNVYYILDRNQSMRHAKALLVPVQPRTGLPIPSKSGIWYMAMARLMAPYRHRDASAIFYILQTRPEILEKQLHVRRRPRPQQQQEQAVSHLQVAAEQELNNNLDNSNCSEASNSDGRKRARLSK